MRTIGAVLLLFGGLAAASAQTTTSGGLFAAATRLITVTPDEARMSVSVTANSTKTLDEVMAKVKDLNLGVENVTSLVTFPGSSSTLPGVPAVPGSVTYSFSQQVPLEQATATLQKITQFGAANSDYRTSGQVSAVGPSLRAIKEAQQRVFGELFQEAKARAEQMSRDAGLSVGRVLAVYDTTYAGGLGVLTGGTTQQVVTVTVQLAID